MNRYTSYDNNHITTPNNSPVYAYVGCTWSDHNTTYDNAYWDNQALKTVYPNAVELNAPFICSTYNCHSYAWYQQGVSNYWINGDDAPIYMTDGSYSASYPLVGREITYKVTNNGITYLGHSGVISVLGSTLDTIYITSKWGVCGLFYHSLTDCTYYSDYPNIAFWKLN